MAFNEFLPWTAAGDTKPEEFKIYLNAPQNQQSQPATADRVNLIQGTTARNTWFDMTPVYVNVDANCPWTNGYIVDKWETTPYAQEFNNDAVSLFPMLSNTLAEGQVNGIARAGSSNFTYGTGETAKYYNMQSWFNAEAKERITNNVKIVFGQVGNGNPVTKFGGQALIAIPFIRAYSTATGGSTIFANADNYFNTNYWNNYPYISFIGVRLYTYNTTKATNKNFHLPATRPYGGAYTSTYQHPTMSILPLLKNESLRLKKNYEDTELSELEMSIFDMYTCEGSSAQNDNLIPLFGAPYGTSSSISTSTITTHYLCVDKLSYNVRASGNYHYFAPVDRSVLGATKEEIQEAVRRRVAYLGLFFAESESFVFNNSNEWTTYEELFTDDRMFCGTIDDSGTTHGDYTRGKRNYGAKQFGSGDLSKDTNVKPITPGGNKGPTSGGDHDREKSEYGGSDFVTNSLKIGDIGLHRYVVDGGDFNLFNRFCKECVDYDLAREQFIAGAMGQGASRSDAAQYWADRFKDEADYKSKMYSKLGYGLDPRNNIVSLMLVPYDVFGFGASEYMKIGDYQINSKFTSELATGSGTTVDIQYAPSANLPGMGDIYNTQFKLCTNDVFNINIGEIVVQHPKGWEDFRAFEPYSRCELYIPFHGNVAINLNQCMGKTLKIVVLMDIITGSSYACVTMNGKLYQAIPGQIGFNVPYSVEASSTTATTLSGLTAQAQSNKLQSSNNLVNGILSTVGNLADGNGLGALTSVVGTYQNAKQLGINERALNFQLAHACDGRSVANAATPLTALCANSKPQLIWHHPIMLAYNDSEYGNLVGYATQRTGRIGSFKGYTKFNNANLSSLSCTETEKGMILAQLQNGVYID